MIFYLVRTSCGRLASLSRTETQTTTLHLLGSVRIGPLHIMTRLTPSFHLTRFAHEPAILYFDYLITFGDEVRFCWRRRPTSATILFFVNRYLSLVGNVPVILQSFRSWDEAVSVTRLNSHEELS